MRLETLTNGWVVGRFDPLDALTGVSHLVTTRRGPDVTLAGRDFDLAAAQAGRALGADGAACCEQVHGRHVAPVDSTGCAGACDGLVTARAGLALAVRGADCPLILAADANGPGIGAVHASWRGTVARVADALVERMVDSLRARPERLTACICPSAGPCCYEIGPDVVEAAQDSLGPDADRFLPRREGRTFFDLWAANVAQLHRAGVPEENIHVAGICTICRNDLFPSYRVEGPAAGRFLAVITRRGSTRGSE